MSKLSPQQTRDALLAGGTIRPAPVLSSAPLYKAQKVEDSRALAIAARKAECLTQEQKNAKHAACYGSGTSEFITAYKKGRAS